MSYDLLQKFTNTIIPDEVKMAMKKGLINSTINRMKMTVFLNNNPVTNENIDYWMSVPPARQDDETYDSYKERQKFQKALTKYRSYIYDYSANINIL